MRQINRISIPKPCRQEWQQMIPTTGGRHCEHCCKTVVDFTEMDSASIINYLSVKHNTCGRFDQQQLNGLNRRLNNADLQAYSAWKKVAIAIGLMSQLSAARALAQIQAPQVHQTADTTKYSRPPHSMMLGKIAMPQQTRTITGTVVDEQNEALPGARILILQCDIETITNKEGKFALEVPLMATQFQVSFIGYTTQQIAIDLSTTTPYSIRCSMSPSLMGDIVIVKAPFFKRMYYKLIKRPVRKLFS